MQCLFIHHKDTSKSYYMIEYDEDNKCENHQALSKDKTQSIIKI